MNALHPDPLVHTLTGLARPLAESLGLVLWGVEIGFSSKSLVRVYVEKKPQGTLGPGSDTDSGTAGTFGVMDDSEAGNESDAPVDARAENEGDDTMFSQSGVNIDDLAELSRLLGLTLDVEDVMPGAYVLEVSSPGLDRVFFRPGQLASAAGRTLDLTLAEPSPLFQGRRKFRGLLEKAPVPDAGGEVPEEAPFTLRLCGVARPGEEEPALIFTWRDVKKVRQVHVTPEKVLPGKGPSRKKADSGGRASKA